MTLSYEIIDDNTHIEAYDPAALFFKIREPFTAYTACEKDNTLFVGNITTNHFSLTPDQIK